MTDQERKERDIFVASQIKDIIKRVSYGREFTSFRASYGTKGTIDLIIELIDKSFIKNNKE